MSQKPRGPWRRGDRPWWYCTVRGKTVRLDVRCDGRDDREEEARQTWHALMAAGGEPADDSEAAEGATVTELLDLYLLWFRDNRPADSFRQVRLRLTWFRDFIGGDRAAASLIPNDLTRWVQSRQWNPTTRGGAMTAVKTAFAWAQREGLAAANPFALVRRPTPQRREFVYDPWQVMLLLDAADGRPIQAFVALLAATGARPSELRRAKASQAGRDGATLLVAKSKTNKPRTVYVPRGQRSLVRELRAAAGGSGPLLPTATGCHWGDSNLCHAFQAARDAAGLPGEATAYGLRHTWITRRVLEGEPLGVVAEMAGTSLQMLSRVYGHLRRADLRAVADRIT